MRTSWIMWALGEGILLTLSSLTSKSVGLNVISRDEVLSVAVAYGILQFLGGFNLSHLWKTRLWINKQFTLWCVFFGISAAIQNIILVTALSQGGDVMVYMFIVIGLSIVPATLIDIAFFKTHLDTFGWLGVAVSGLAGYVLLGFPSLKAIILFPPWITLAFSSMFLFAINQGLSRALAKVSEGVDGPTKAFTQSVWMGLSSASVCIGVIVYEGGTLSFGDLPPLANVGVLIVGLLAVLILAARMMAFARGANIPMRKTVAIGTFLSLLAISSHYVFNDPFGWEKFGGIILYVLALLLLQQNETNQKKKVVRSA